MANPQFRCPHCNVVQVKSDIDQVLADAGGFVSFGSPTVTCRGCRGQIDRTAVIKGQYDEKLSLAGCMMPLVVLVSAIILFLLFFGR